MIGSYWTVRILLKERKVSKTAIVTGFSGMDGSIMAQLLLYKGYKVYGVIRRTSNPSHDFIKEMGLEQVELIHMDLADSGSINRVISDIKPDEFYNFAAQSHVGTSFKEPVHTANITGLGPIRILDAIRQFSPKTKFYQASTSELFGSAPAPQNEATPLVPNSPYAAAKLLAHNTVRIYRESYGIFASSSLLFNHECYRRSKDFVTRKITAWLGDNFDANGKRLNDSLEPLLLGNLDAKRDWGYAPDYCYAIWKIMQLPYADDFVIGTGQEYSIREFFEEACQHVGFHAIKWEGSGSNEIGYDVMLGDLLVKVDPSFYRPLEVNHLRADITKAKRILNWQPITNFQTLVESMMEYDLYDNSKHQSDYAKKAWAAYESS
jgi:GDPmannose 4,6-dehydratase